jgi:multidrug efflux pump subunit AcrB
MLVTTFLAFAPMFFMGGVFGEFVVSIPLVITLAVLMSVAEVIVALPAHLVSGISRIDPSRGARRAWFSRLRSLFRAGASRVLRLRYVFLGVSLLLFAGSLAVASLYLDFVLFPSDAANAFSIRATLPQGSSLQHTERRMRDVERAVETIPEGWVASYATYVGTHGATRPEKLEHLAFVRVDLTPFSERDVTAAEIVETLRARTDDLAGFEDIVYDVEAGGPPVGAPVQVRVVGTDDETRTKLADAVVRELETVGGVHDIDRNDVEGKPVMRLSLDHDEIPFLGLSVARVARTVRLAFDGEEATRVRYGDEDVDFRVILDEQSRRRTETVDRLLVMGRDGGLVPLGNIATLVSSPGPAIITHYEGRRSVTITADLDKEENTPLEVTRRVESAFDLAGDWPGMRLVWGGEAEETEESFRTLGIAFAIAIVAIYFVLVLLFDSFTQPIMVMVAIPFGVIAVILAFAVHGQTPGFLAALGLVGLTGVVVNDSLVMVDHINGLRRRRPDDPILDVVADGAADRLRPIVMTTITTVVGLLPLAYGIGGSDPLIAPMALSLGYGLLFATPLTLLMIPSLYLVREDIARLLLRAARRLRRR